MARPGLLTHRKFSRLVFEMGKAKIGDEAAALGHLEFIFISCSNAAEPYLGTSDDVESVARYKALDGRLCEALFTAGFLDKDQNGLFYLHDLEENATEAARKRIQRRKADKETKTADNGGQRRTTADNGGQRRTTADFVPPSVPIRSLPNKDLPVSDEKTPKRTRIKYSSEFETFWSLSSQRGSKKDAYTEWQKLEEPDKEDCLARTPRWVAAFHDPDRPNYTVHVCRYLKARRWEDRLPSEKGDKGSPNVPKLLLTEKDWSEATKHYLGKGS